jgi:hypothetical protein
MRLVWSLHDDPDATALKALPWDDNPYKTGAGIYGKDAESFIEEARQFSDRYTKAIEACDAVTTPGYFFDQSPDDLYPSTCRVIRERWLEPAVLLPALEGLRILVVTPFVSTIRRQSRRWRKNWFQPMVYPRFKLELLRAPQTHGYAIGSHGGWSGTMQWLEQLVGQRRFDVAIIGAGSYSMPLGHYIRSLGGRALCAGGFAVTYFGVTYQRIQEQHLERGWHPWLANPGWVRPFPDERVEGFQAVEEGCYW